jgi:hypothetical protein
LCDFGREAIALSGIRAVAFLYVFIIIC